METPPRSRPPFALRPVPSPRFPAAVSPQGWQEEPDPAAAELHVQAACPVASDAALPERYAGVTIPPRLAHRECQTCDAIILSLAAASTASRSSLTARNTATCMTL